MVLGAPMAWGHDDWERAKYESRALLGQSNSGLTWRPRAIFECIFWPTLLFCYVYYWSYGSWRFYNWKAAVAMGPVVCTIVCLLVSWTARLLFRHHLPCRRNITLSACMWLALLGGWWAGDQNYGHNMISYHTYQDLASYVDVDPAKSKGQTYMDAGEVYFHEGTEVSTNDMVSFRSRTNFCAAPILGQPLRNQKGPLEVEMEGDIIIPESGSIDFWAVGTDCCDQSTREFTCGQTLNKRARAGMRMIREDYRPFYLLAVQEWTARMCPTSGEDNTASGHAKAAPLMCLPARHPLFFTWVEDPVSEVVKYSEQAYRQSKTDVFVFMAFDVFLAFGMLYVLQQLGFT